MSDKDPVREQIDLTTRDRMIDGDLSDLSYFDAAVQIAYDQDKIAWNRCLDEVIKEIDLEVDGLMMSWKSSRAESLTKLKYIIEKLRR